MRDTINGFCETFFCKATFYVLFSALLLVTITVLFAFLLVVGRYFIAKGSTKTDKLSVYEQLLVRDAIKWVVKVGTTLFLVVKQAAKTFFWSPVNIGDMQAPALPSMKVVKYGLLGIGFFGASFAMHEYHGELLIIVDILWTFFRYAFLNTVSIILLSIRLIISSVVPAWNFIWRVVIQIIAGTFIIITKCQISHVVEALQYAFGIPHELGTNLVNWVSNDPTDTPLKLEKMFENIYKLILMPREVLNCVCERLDVVWEFVFFYSPNVSPTLNHLLNIPLTAVMSAVGGFGKFLVGGTVPSPIFENTFVAQEGFYVHGSGLVDNIFGHFATLGLQIMNKPVNFATAPSIGLGQALGRLGVGYVLLQRGITTGAGLIIPGSTCYNKTNYPTASDKYGCIKKGLDMREVFTEIDRSAYFVGANINWVATVAYRLLYDDLESGTVPTHGAAQVPLSAFDEPIFFKCFDFHTRDCWEGKHGYCDMGTSYCNYPDEASPMGTCNTCNDFSYVRDCERLSSSSAIKNCKKNCFSTCGCEVAGFSYCDMSLLSNSSTEDNGICNACPAQQVECWLAPLNAFGKSDCIGQCFNDGHCDAAAVSYFKEDGTCGQCREFFDKQESSCASNKLLTTKDRENCEKQCFNPCDCSHGEFCMFDYGNVGLCSKCSKSGDWGTEEFDKTRKCYQKVRISKNTSQPLKAAAIYDCDSSCQKQCGCERFGRTDGLFCRSNLEERFQDICNLNPAECSVTDSILAFTASILESNYSLCESCATIEQDRGKCTEFGADYYGQEKCEDRCFRDPFPSFADQIAAPRLVSSRREETPYGNTLLELLSRAGGCAALTTIRIIANTAHVQYSLATSLVLDWMLPMFEGEYEKQNHPIKIMQRHEGQWFTYGHNISCEYRDKFELNKRAPPSAFDYGYNKSFPTKLTMSYDMPYNIIQVDDPWDIGVFETLSENLYLDETGTSRNPLPSGTLGRRLGHYPGTAGHSFNFDGSSDGANYKSRCGRRFSHCSSWWWDWKEEEYMKCGKGSFMSNLYPGDAKFGCDGSVPADCQWCPSGQYSDSCSDGPCKVCPAGTVSNVKVRGATGCVKCRAGQQFAWDWTAAWDGTAEGLLAYHATCPYCPIDTWLEESSSMTEMTTAKCKACPTGTFIGGVGLGTSFAACIPNQVGCPVGTRASSATDCTTCDDGKFTSEEDPTQGVCKVCEYGKTSGNVEKPDKLPPLARDRGSCAPLQCGYNRYLTMAATSRGTCRLCPSSRYQITTAATAYLENTATPSECKVCPIGFNYKQSQTVPCTKCPVGLFSGPNMPVCAACTGNKLESCKCDPYDMTTEDGCYSAFCRLSPPSSGKAPFIPGNNIAEKVRLTAMALCKTHAKTYGLKDNLIDLATGFSDPDYYTPDITTDFLSPDGLASLYSLSLTVEPASEQTLGQCLARASPCAGGISCPLKVQTNFDATMCVSCPSGWRKYGYYCRKCGAGRFTSWHNLETCAGCSAGQYQDNWGSSVCKHCNAAPDWDNVVDTVVNAGGSDCVNITSRGGLRLISIITTERSDNGQGDDDETIQDYKVDDCPTMSYAASASFSKMRDNVDGGDTQCERCPRQWVAFSRGSKACTLESTSPTSTPTAPTSAPTSSPLVSGQTTSPTPSPTPFEPAKNQWFTKRTVKANDVFDPLQGSGAAETDLESRLRQWPWVTVETILKIVRTHVIYVDWTDEKFDQVNQRGLDLAVGDLGPGLTPILSSTSSSVSFGSDGCEGDSDPFWHRTDPTATVAAQAGKIESPCEQSMGYLYEATWSEGHGIGCPTPSAACSTRGRARIVVQCITWDSDRFQVTGDNIKKPFGGAAEYIMKPDNLHETGGFGISPGMRRGHIKGTLIPKNGCSDKRPCGDDFTCPTCSNFITPSAARVGYFTGCTWRKFDRHSATVQIGPSGSLDLSQSFNPYPYAFDWPLHKRSACLVDKVLPTTKTKYLTGYMEQGNYTNVWSSYGCGVYCNNSGYDAFQWTYDSQDGIYGTSVMSDARCMCLKWNQFSFSFNKFITTATYDSPSCGIWGKRKIENKFTNDLILIDETHTSSATECADYCNFFIGPKFKTDGFVFEPRPFSFEASETPLCSCVSLKTNITWDDIDASSFSSCSEQWKKTRDTSAEIVSQRCNVSSKLYEPFMEKTVNLNAHVIPQYEVFGDLMVNTIPSRTITAYLLPIKKTQTVFIEFWRLGFRFLSTLVEAVLEPRAFYDSNMKGDFGKNWVTEGETPYVACTFEEWQMGVTDITDEYPTHRDCTCVSTYPKKDITEDFAADAYGSVDVNVALLYSAETQASWCNSLMAERVFRSMTEVGYAYQSEAEEIGRLYNIILDRDEHTCSAEDLVRGSDRKLKTATGWIKEYNRPLISGVETVRTGSVTEGLSELETCTSAFNRNLFCAAGATLKFSSEVVVGTYRQLFETLMKVVRGSIPMTEFTNRLCQAQRFVHSFSSALVDIVPLDLFIPDKTLDPIRVAFGNLIFGILEIPIESAKVANLLFWSVQSIFGGGANIIDILFQDIYVVSQIVAGALINVLNGGADFMNGIVPSSGAFFETAAKIVHIGASVVGKTVIQILSLFVKIFMQFIGLFAGGDFMEFITDVLLVAEKIWSTMVEGMLYMALKMFKLDKNLGVMASLSTALNSLAGWVNAWIDQIFCMLQSAIINGIADVVAGLENVIDETVNDFINGWNECSVCPGEIGILELGWAQGIRDLIGDGCLTRDKCKLGVKDKDGVQLWLCGAKAGPNTQEYCPVQWNANLETCSSAFVGPGFGYTHHNFRYNAYNRYAELIKLRYAKRYKVCTEEVSEKYGFVNYFSSNADKRADEAAAVRSCDDIQRCVNTGDEGWLDLDGDAPLKEFWQDVYYKEIADEGTSIFLPKKFYDDSTSDGLSNGITLMNSFFGGGRRCNGESWCIEEWSYSQATTKYPSDIFPIKNRKRDINIDNLFLMDRYCPSEPVLTFDYIGEGEMEQGRKATGCFRYIQDNVLIDEVGFEKPMAGGVLSPAKIDTLNLKGKLNVWSQPHDSAVPFMSNCINRCSMFYGSDSPTKSTTIFGGGDDDVNRIDVSSDEYSVGLIRLVTSEIDPSPDTDFCFCLPNKLVDKFWVEPADRCSIAYHSTSGRSERGLFSQTLPKGTVAEYNGDETCLGGYNTKQMNALNLVNVDDMPYKARRRKMTWPVIWDTGVPDPDNPTKTISESPTCGFSYSDDTTNINDDGLAQAGAGNLNKDYYFSIYKTRNIIRQEWTSHTSVRGARRRLLSAVDYDVPPTLNATEMASNYFWNEGQSRCDQIGRVYKVLEWQNRPISWLEEIEFRECLSLRIYGEQVGNSLMVEDFPRDIFYHWQRKYLLGLDFFYGTFIMVQWAMHRHNETDYNVTAHITSALMHPTTFLSFTHLITGQMIDHSKIPQGEMEGIDDLYNESGIFNYSSESSGEMADDIRMETMSAASRIFHELSKHDIGMEFSQLQNGLSVIHDAVIAYKGTTPDLTPLTDAIQDKAGELIRPHNGHRLTYRLGLMTYVKNNYDEDYDCLQFPHICTECAIIDNPIEDIFLGTVGMVEYYTKGLPKIISDFGSRFDSIIDPSEDQTTINALAQEHIGNVKHARAKRKRLRKIRLTSGLNTTEIDHDIDSIQEFAAAVKSFFETTNSDPVPFFRHGLSHWLFYPFEEGCDIESVIYNPPPNSQTKIDVLSGIGYAILGFTTLFVINRIDDGPKILYEASVKVIAAPLISIPLVGFQLYNFVSSWTVLQFVLMPTSIYIYSVYSYTPLCLPYIPHGIIDDMSYTLEEFINSISCLCRYLPNMSEECTSECTEYSLLPYKDCAVLLKNDGFSELWVFWLPVLSIQLILPWLFSSIFIFFPFSQLLVWFPSLNEIAKIDFSNISPTHIQCGLVNILDFASAGLIGAAVGGGGYYIIINMNTIVTLIVDLNITALQILGNATIIIRTSKVPLKIQIVILSVLLALILSVVTALQAVFEP